MSKRRGSWPGRALPLDTLHPRADLTRRYASRTRPSGSGCGWLSERCWCATRVGDPQRRRLPSRPPKGTASATTAPSISKSSWHPRGLPSADADRARREAALAEPRRRSARRRSGRRRRSRRRSERRRKPRRAGSRRAPSARVERPSRVPALLEFAQRGLWIHPHTPCHLGCRSLGGTAVVLWRAGTMTPSDPNAVGTMASLTCGRQPEA